MPTKNHRNSVKCPLWLPLPIIVLKDYASLKTLLKPQAFKGLCCVCAHTQIKRYFISFLLLNMSMATRSLEAIFLVLLLVDAVVPLTVTAAYSSIHELLRSHGLPAGLFPETVKSYNLDQRGRLEVQLDQPCMAKYETRVLFETVVRANLSFGQLKGLEGLSQEELFLWLPVKDIIVNDPSSGLILIDIGVAHKQLSLSLFEDPPVCRSQGLSLKIPGRKSVGFQDQR